MNLFIQMSIDFANQRNYLDELFKVYPTIPEGMRDIDEEKWEKIEIAFHQKDKVELLKLLLSLDLFPIKDSYVAYLKRDPSAIERNPATVDRLYGRIQELGLDEIWKRCSQPKETNRQIGPLFKRWLNKGVLGVPNLLLPNFLKSNKNAILNATEPELKKFAYEHLNYKRNKGLDFVARFNGKYIIGEAKFLTDFGGHQNAQFNDAINTLTTKNVNAEKVAILDGVLYIKGNNKMYKEITTTYSKYNIMSVLVLREFLFQV